MSEEFDLYAKDDDPRSEKTLSAILGNYDGELDGPKSRVEAYLLAIKEMLEGGGGGGGSVTVDTELKPNSTNPVQNKAIYEAIAEVAEAATSEKTGLVKPDGTSTVVDENGTMSVKPSILQTIQDATETAEESASKIENVLAGAHNCIYRGKNLGTSVTAEQWAFIQAGTFTDMYIGDYWVIDGITWRIAAFDYWLGFGDTACNVHHIVIVPDQNLLNAHGSTTCYMNPRNVTTGGYIGSEFRSGTAREQCRSKIQAAFDASHILTHSEYFTNAVTNGYASTGSWYDSDVDLMNEIMVYGCPIFTPANNGTTIPCLYTIGNSQLPLFKLNHAHICNHANWWLRDPVSSAYFAIVDASGDAGSTIASHPGVGVRPAFGIC